MKPVWIAIAAITLGASFAVTTRISAYAREANSPDNTWTRNSAAMTRLYGADWCETMMASYRTNYPQWQGMKHAYLTIIQKQ